MKKISSTNFSTKFASFKYQNVVPLVDCIYKRHSIPNQLFDYMVLRNKFCIMQTMCYTSIDLFQISLVNIECLFASNSTRVLIHEFDESSLFLSSFFLLRFSTQNNWISWMSTSFHAAGNLKVNIQCVIPIFQILCIF